jgi:serine/threonine-protein kinase HipA
MTTQLEVTMHDRLVATITNIPGDTNVVAIDPDFAADPTAPALSFKAFRDPITGRYRERIRPTQTAVHPFFANLLPEGPLRTYLAKHARVKPMRDFPLLWLLGNDLPGALVLRNPEGDMLPPHDDTSAPDLATDGDRVFRFSLAGVQIKFSATGDPKRGLTIPVGGMGGHWIVKLADQRYEQVPENEFSMMTFAREVGLDVPRIGLVRPSDIAGLPRDVSFAGQAYYIERFDRVGDARVHTEDFAQANLLYPDDKYRRFNFDMLTEQVATYVGEEAALDVIRRIVFSIGIGNADMHAKNWSIIYPDGRSPRLAPVYDFLSTIVYIPDGDFNLNLAGTKAFADLDDSRFARLAAHARLPRKPVLDAAHDMAERMLVVWPEVRADLPLNAEHRAMITAHMIAQPLFATRRINATP